MDDGSSLQGRTENTDRMVRCNEAEQKVEEALVRGRNQSDLRASLARDEERCSSSLSMGSRFSRSCIMRSRLSASTLAALLPTDLLDFDEDGRVLFGKGVKGALGSG